MMRVPRIRLQWDADFFPGMESMNRGRLCPAIRLTAEFGVKSPGDITAGLFDRGH